MRDGGPQVSQGPGKMGRMGAVPSSVEAGHGGPDQSRLGGRVGVGISAQQGSGFKREWEEGLRAPGLAGSWWGPEGGRVQTRGSGGSWREREGEEKSGWIFYSIFCKTGNDAEEKDTDDVSRDGALLGQGR